MVIDIDRKKIANTKWQAVGAVIGYVPWLLLFSWNLGNDLRDGMPLFLALLFFVPIMLLWVGSAVSMWRISRRALRHHRTEHHLYADETGLTMVNGHARVDIPWGDVESISIGAIRVINVIMPRNIKLQLRKESLYSKRMYRLYDDYELSLDELYAQVDEMWTAGNLKPKLLTI